MSANRARRVEPGGMRNPMTGALAAMALHAGMSVVLGWPCPSVATFLGGVFAVVAVLTEPNAPPKVASGMAALAVLMPSVFPPPLLAASISATVVTLVPAGRGLLANAAVALPALTFLSLALAV